MSKHSAAITACTVSAASTVLLITRRPRFLGLRLPRWVPAGIAAVGLAVAVNEWLGKPVLLLRWSFVRFLFGLRHMGATWQVGDGREQALADYVCAHARRNDIDDAIRVIDEFCYTKRYMINIGDEKGRLLDRAVSAAHPRRLLELGTYCGYSALRIARVMPTDAVLYSIEFNPANAAVARRIWDRAGTGERIVVVVGTLGDDGRTLGVLRDEHGFAPGTTRFRVPRPREGRIPSRPAPNPGPRMAAPRLGCGRRQRQIPRRPAVSRVHASPRGSRLAHPRTPVTRRIPKDHQRPRSGIDLPRPIGQRAIDAAARPTSIGMSRRAIVDPAASARGPRLKGRGHRVKTASAMRKRSVPLPRTIHRDSKTVCR